MECDRRSHFSLSNGKGKVGFLFRHLKVYQDPRQIEESNVVCTIAQTNRVKTAIFIVGGLKDDEFGVWLQHHPAIFTEHEDELVLLTGKVPLLLSIFARVYNDGDSWASMVKRVQQDAIVEEWMTFLTKFYANIDANQVCRVFMLSVDSIFDFGIVDFRFFYQDCGFCAASDIVRRLVYHVWTMRSAHDALLMRWPDLLSRASNPSVLGFDVEEIITAKICQQGAVRNILYQMNG